jgi:hypothetical protein
LAGIHGAINGKQLKKLVGSTLASQRAVVPDVKIEKMDSIPQTVSGKTLWLNPIYYIAQPGRILKWINNYQEESTDEFIKGKYPVKGKK